MGRPFSFAMTAQPPDSPLDWTEDDQPRSRLFGDVYFSAEDGLAETRAVFLDGQVPKNKGTLLACAESSQASPAWKPWVEFGKTMYGPTLDPIWIKGYDGDPVALLKDLQAKANAKYFPNAKP